jgi:hypothetical protein
VTFLGQGSVTPLRGIADRRAAGAAQPAELSDLSFTGVGLRVPEDRSYPLRAVLRLRLPLGGRSRDELLAEVVHTRDAPDGMVHHGCRFLDPTAALHRDLQSKVIRLQQEEVVRRQEEAEASRTGNPSPAHGAPGHPGPARDEDATTRLGDRDEAAPGKSPRPHAEDPARPAAPATAHASNKMRSDDATVFNELRSIASQDSGSAADLALVTAHLPPEVADKAAANLVRRLKPGITPLAALVAWARAHHGPRRAPGFPVTRLARARNAHSPSARPRGSWSPPRPTRYLPARPHHGL